MKKRSFDIEAWTRIMMYYAEMCVQRGYHHRYIARRLRELEDAFDGRNQ